MDGGTSSVRRSDDAVKRPVGISLASGSSSGWRLRISGTQLGHYATAQQAWEAYPRTAADRAALAQQHRRDEDKRQAASKPKPPAPQLPQQASTADRMNAANAARAAMSADLISSANRAPVQKVQPPTVQPLSTACFV